MKTNPDISYNEPTSASDIKKAQNLDLSPYYVFGLPILLFLALLASFSLALTAIYEYCF